MPRVPYRETITKIAKS
jgi:elongation factor G